MSSLQVFCKRESLARRTRLLVHTQVFSTERLKSIIYKTLIYNPRRRAQEFLGRFQKGLPRRAPGSPRGVKLRIATTSHGTKLDRSLFLFLICERFVDAARPSRISFPSENNRTDVTCRRSSLPDCGFAAALKHCCHHLGSKIQKELVMGQS